MAVDALQSASAVERLAPGAAGPALATSGAAPSRAFRRDSYRADRAQLDIVGRSPAVEGERFDEADFPQFAPLLTASRAYASRSGYRFRSQSFDGIKPAKVQDGKESEPAVVSTQRARDSGPRLAAKLLAAPAVREFQGRLRVGEAALLEELQDAIRIVLTESVRNIMVSKCKELCMFPPSPMPAGISEEDCHWEATTEPLPVLAQRLYNDEVQRRPDKHGQPSLELKRVLTAAWIVEFAEEAGLPVPSMPDTHQKQLEEFLERSAEWAEHGYATVEAEQQEPATDAATGRGFGTWAGQLRGLASGSWLEDAKSKLRTGAEGAAHLGATAVSSALAVAVAHRREVHGDGKAQGRQFLSKR